MANTPNNNLILLPSGSVDWVAVYNDAMNKIEVGRTLLLVAGESLVKRDIFYIHTDGKVYKATTTTSCHGVWQSDSTAADAQGYGQISGTMTYSGWSWTPGDKLYSDASGALTTAVTSYQVGIAISATTICIIIPLNSINDLVFTPLAIGFSVAGGTTSKTLTVSENTTLNGGTHSGTNTGDQDLSGYLTKTDNLGSVANAATAFGNIKQSATTSATGVSELATTDETITGTDTARTTTPAGVAGAMAVQTNPLAKSQGVRNLGNSSIQVADNDNLDNPINNFSIVWTGSLDDWIYTGSYDSFLFRKYASNYGVAFKPAYTGHLTLDLYRNDIGTPFLSTSINTFIDGTEHQLIVVVTRETASTPGSVVFYVDGHQFGDSVEITAAETITIANSASADLMYPIGGTAYKPQNNKELILYNRALTAAEVLDLYRHGIAFADKWGSQTSLVTGDDSTFNSDTGWWTKGDGSVTIADGVCHFTNTPTSKYLRRASLLTGGKKYRIIFTISNRTEGSIDLYITNELVANYASDQTVTVEFTPTQSSTGYLIFQSNGETSLDIDNVFVYEIGATLALESEGIQPAPGQWLDSSGNKLHAMQPASGSSLIRKKDTFEVRWTNTWAGTHEAQYIGGVNQAVLPANCYIESIIGVISGSTIEDIIIGDGSDTDRWVAITTGLSTGTTSFTLANRISDGTNYKLVVDPDANFTGSIAWTIKGIILQ